jgi:arabinogalactan endo-1,4-beta-galactosidase
LPCLCSSAATAFIAGADFSHLAFFEDRGIVYRDAGQVEDGFLILKNHGLTCARLRLFTSSAAQAQADPYNYTNNLAYTLPLAVRLKNAGMQFMLDFHYSDTWADPAHQAKPTAWTSLTFAQLVGQMRDYNSNCITAFKVAGAMPDFVAVGNEITSGLLWPDGKVGGTNDTSAQWSQLGQLMIAAVQGIRSAAGTDMPKIIVHIDRGADWSTTQWFFDHLNAQGVQFDIIGQSYYPYWHGSLSALSNCLTNAAKRYDKPVIVAETDFPWGSSTNIYGIPATTNGQVQYVAALAQVVKSVPGGLGAGIFWWGGEYQSLSGYNLGGFDKRSFFGSGAGSPVPAGDMLPVVGALGTVAGPMVVTAALNGLNLTLQWPLSGAGMTPRTATSLNQTSAWITLTNAIQNTGTLFYVTVPLGSTQTRFYRLQSN